MKFGNDIKRFVHVIEPIVLLKTFYKATTVTAA